jgi:hypothetical protein
MARAKRAQGEGANSTHVTDLTKIRCQYCGSTWWQTSSVIDDPNDITDDSTFAALLLTAAGGVFTGLVGQCHCGREQVLWWMICDVAASNGTTLTMTNLDQATTANLMAGLYMYPLAGTDIGKYFIVSTNTAAAPTVITPTVAPNADCDGYWIVTNLLPVGYTAAA